ncbi:phosphoribosylanthranilate isomerase [Frigoribacterium faeni]|uniref:N-(5'-phosphoribosyl)anthranilate isomerase n=1 Tax=Frigoribacterium faeni TaxID=145483 RepID=A0A7W3JJV7_9MICO|nr:phosphoribosylanthranilate isomerase [Frigoribacterium faeni]MBA8814084.1 phosphoribosylanthranilate isomerase [Frigoribacterium faeni]BFF16111.1 N-(5'-phosphoribosyl)anthranilate isomerase [Microbacterium flavescens]GEK82676.1 N-(5'-phosphoribosyl)anthranilate isomerase [Frigoribacterium faeni]
MSIWVKICGLTTVDAVETSVAAGADAVGFVLAPGSPRTLDAPSARRLAERVPPTVETVGVFRGQPLGEVLDLAVRSGVRSVQLHGDETPSDVAAARAAGFRVIRAVDAGAYAAEPEEARVAFAEDALLIDAADPGAGATFDAAPLLAAPPHRPWILAGGLAPDNVERLVGELGPVGVDVSSGVESSRGVKDLGLIREFVAAARRL